jgi:outer membrane protein OmpA-like peptidoglycan-associated protein
MNKIKFSTITFILFFTTNVLSQTMFSENKIDSISVFFEKGSFKVKNESALLSKLNSTRKSRYGRIQLNSFTDSVGTISYNQKLASNRLKSITELILVSNFKDFQIDTININESNLTKCEIDCKRVDIIFFEIVDNFKLNQPIILNIHFEVASDIFTKESYESLNNLYKILVIKNDLKITLKGHVCCAPGYETSLKRAKAVEKYLTKKGISKDRITCIGYSNSKKLYDEYSEENKRKNRRVEVEFHY